MLPDPAALATSGDQIHEGETLLTLTLPVLMSKAIHLVRIFIAPLDDA